MVVAGWQLFDKVLRFGENTPGGEHFRGHRHCGRTARFSGFAPSNSSESNADMAIITVD